MQLPAAQDRFEVQGANGERVVCAPDKHDRERYPGKNRRSCRFINGSDRALLLFASTFRVFEFDL
jgi:hypothetical protein